MTLSLIKDVNINVSFSLFSLLTILGSNHGPVCWDRYESCINTSASGTGNVPLHSHSTRLKHAYNDEITIFLIRFLHSVREVSLNNRFIAWLRLTRTGNYKIHEFARY